MLQRLLQFGTTYFPGAVCDSQPMMLGMGHFSLEPADFQAHAACRLNPIHAEMGEFAPAP